MKRGSVLIGVVAIAGLTTVGLMEVTAGSQKERTARTQRTQQRVQQLSPAVQRHSPNAQRQAEVMESQEGGVAGGSGPDVIVGSLHDLAHYTGTGAIGGLRAYAVGTTSCNIGTEHLSWIAETNQHPVIGQSIYRLKDDRIEHIGQGWLKHGFFALWESLCDNCTGSFSTCGGNCLIVGCSDPYSAGLNGDNTGSGLGPKSQVNASTGFFTYPHAQSNCGAGTLCERVQVRQTDLEPHAFGTNARYFVEGHYITPDDTAAGNDDNNASYRRVWINTNYSLTFNNPSGGSSQTVREVPAIYAWQAADPEVHVEVIDIPDDGRVIVAYKVTDNGDGTWRYEYAVHNLNSHRSIGSFSLPASDSAAITDIGFHDVDYHSGEPYDGTDWPGVHSSGALAWATTPFSTNSDANAIRWGTLYNFRFVADAPPVDGEVTLGLFRPPSTAGDLPSEMSFIGQVPDIVEVCPADMVDSSFNPPGDGIVDGSDLAYLLGEWGENPGSLADIVDTDTFEPPPDGTVDGADLAYLLGAWGDCD